MKHLCSNVNVIHCSSKEPYILLFLASHQMTDLTDLLHLNWKTFLKQTKLKYFHVWAFCILLIHLRCFFNTKAGKSFYVCLLFCENGNCLSLLHLFALSETCNILATKDTHSHYCIWGTQQNLTIID